MSIAFVFALLAWRIIPIARFIDHSVKATGLIIGYSSECTQIQYTDTTGKILTTCNYDLQGGDVGTEIEIWFFDSIPTPVMVQDPLLMLLRYSLAGFGWFASVMACMWWYSLQLEKWASDQGLTLMLITFVSPWNNPLGKRFRINLILRTYKVLTMNEAGREAVAWIRFKPLYMPTARPTVLWAEEDDASEEDAPVKPPQSAPEKTLPSGGLTDILEQRKKERKTAVRDAHNELLF
jgi:hypothetical protein